MRTTRILAGLGSAILIAGCSSDVGSEKSEALGQTGLAITTDILADTDVGGMRFAITPVQCGPDGGGPIGATTTYERELEDMLIPGAIDSLKNRPLDENSAHLFADQFFSVAPGCYDVVTTPLTANGEPSQDCFGAHKRNVEVVAGVTNELVLINQCKGQGRSAIDIISAINHAPEVKVEFKRSKFVRACQTQEICATVHDPDKDPLEFVWTASVDGVAQPSPEVTSTTTADNGDVTQCVSFVPEQPGKVDLSVTVYDLAHRDDGTQIRIEDWLSEAGYPNNSHAVLSLPSYAGDSACQMTYTLDADFERGTIVNLNHSPIHDQLALNSATVEPFPFVCLALSGRNSLVRIDAESGKVLGEYKSTPDDTAGNPARTVADKYGNCWVANASEISDVNGQERGSVARVGLILGGERGTKDANGVFVPQADGHYVRPNPTFRYNTCVDRDGDGLIKTSAGLLDTLSWSNPNGVDTAGNVSSAEDECIINYTRTAASGVRTLAVDKDNNLWVGGIGNYYHEHIDGVSGQPIGGSSFLAQCGGYGGVVDGYGTLWSALNSGEGLLRFVPDSANPPGERECLTDRGNYGLGIDRRTGHVWHSSESLDYQLFELDASGNVVNQYEQPFDIQGVAVDAKGHVWAAESAGSRIWHLAPDPANPGGRYIDVGIVSELDGTSGLAVDGKGRIWAPEGFSSSIARVNPALAGGTGAVDLRVDLGPDALPTDYSDMTGFVSFGVAQPQGVWDVVHEGCSDQTVWGSVSWNATLPEGSQAKVEVRAANSAAGLTAQTFQTVTSAQDLSSLNLVGRFIEVRTTLSRDFDSSAVPSLQDLTVQCAQ